MLQLAYAAIKKRLSAETSPRYIDWYLGQYLEQEAEEGGQLLWDTPAQFIEFLPVSWQTLGGNVQVTDLAFNLHLVNDSYHDDDQRILDAAVNHLGQEALVFRSLMNWRCNLSYAPGFEALDGDPADRVLLESIVRDSTEPDHNLRRQLVSVQRFSCRVYDYGATKTWVTVQALLDVDVEKVDKLTP